MPTQNGVVYHGSCQQLAALGGLHAVRPDKWPMTGAALGDIVHWTIANGLASASGASAPRAMRAYFAFMGVPYSEYPTSQLDAVIDTYGGRYPIIVEYSQAHNLPGDEAGVMYHYNCIVGVNTADKSVLAVDGDNLVVRASPTGYGPLCNYARASIHAAAPVHVMVIRWVYMITLSDPIVAKYFTTAPNNAGLQCIQTGAVIRNGSMLDFYCSMPYDYNGLWALGLPLTDEIPVPNTGSKVQVYERGALAYDPNREYDDPPGAEGDVYLAHVDKGVAHDWLTSH